MWIVKLGGSLLQGRALAPWLDLLAGAGAGRVAIVPGGGTLADEVRRLQAQWGFDDLAAHNMAVLAMCQTAQLMQALQPRLALVDDEAQLAATLRCGAAAVWQPLGLRRASAGPTTHWGHTSDSLALDLAQRQRAERLIVVKSAAIGARSLGQLSADGVLDAGFAAAARGAGCAVHVLGPPQLATLHGLLQGEALAPTPP